MADPPPARIFDQFLRGGRRRSMHTRRSREIHRKRGNAAKSLSPGKRSACNRCSRKGETAIGRGIIYWNCRYGSRSLFYPCKGRWAHVFRACARACACVTVARRVQPRMPNLSHGINHWFAGNDLCCVCMLRCCVCSRGDAINSAGPLVNEPLRIRCPVTFLFKRFPRLSLWIPRSFNP